MAGNEMVEKIAKIIVGNNMEDNYTDCYLLLLHYNNDKPL